MLKTNVLRGMNVKNLMRMITQLLPQSVKVCRPSFIRLFIVDSILIVCVQKRRVLIKCCGSKQYSKAEERALVFQSELDLLSEEVPFSLHKLTVDSEVIQVAHSSSLPLVRLLMRDYNHEDEDDSPEQTFTHTVSASTVPVNDDLVLFQSIQHPDYFRINAPQKAHIIDKAHCLGRFSSLKDCPDNFLALSSELHEQFDGRSVTPSGVPSFVIIPEEITSTASSSSISSKRYINVKVRIFFHSDTAGAIIIPRLKHFETDSSNQSVLMFLAAANPQIFAQCLNWKGMVEYLPLSFALYSFSPFSQPHS